MKKAIIVFIVAISIVIFATLSFSSDFATAKLQTKVHFTKTLSSSQDPGGQNNQFALVLAPNKGSLYRGSLTYTATEPIEVVVLHEIEKSEAKGQQTWSVDGNTVYVMSVIEPPVKARSYEFTGAALAFRSKSTFTVTASVDGWIRGQPTEITVQKFEIKEKSFSLADSHVPVTIPMHLGFFGKESVYYIVTDSSNKTLAEKISEKQNWKTQFAPKLRWAPASSQDTIYTFTNGIKGDGMYGFQDEVFSSTPKSDDYSPLRSLVTVSWKPGQKPQVINSAEEILKAEKERRLVLTKTNVTLNAPQIVWPGGQLFVRNGTNLSNEISFEKGQVIEISKDSKKVTFVAHRAWGPDGRTTYHIISDVTPVGPADLIGVPVSSKLANVLSSAAFSDMYQFKNGLKGSGPLGFQQNVLSTKLDESYVPICRVSIVEWKSESTASILETISDIDKKKSDGVIYVSLARPLSNDYMVNCPLIELK
jgi:hypothetical protein